VLQSGEFALHQSAVLRRLGEFIQAAPLSIHELPSELATEDTEKTEGKNQQKQTKETKRYRQATNTLFLRYLCFLLFNFLTLCVICDFCGSLSTLIDGTTGTFPAASASIFLSLPRLVAVPVRGGIGGTSPLSMAALRE